MKNIVEKLGFQETDGQFFIINQKWCRRRIYKFMGEIKQEKDCFCELVRKPNASFDFSFEN